MNLPGLRKALASLPKTLYDTYARILCNIDADQHQYAFKILQWLAYSARPLKLAEVAEVIAIGVEERPRFDPGVRFPEPRDILTLCSSLISLEDETVKDIQDDSNTVVVRLAHFSVKEYLSSNAILQGKLNIYSIQEISANVSICNDCLAYLLELNGLNSLTPQFFAEYPLARYAARFWVQHAQVAERDSSFNPSLVIELLLTSGCGFLNWISLYDPNHRGLEPNVARSSNSLLPPLYYASMAGLYKIARVLLDKGADVNASDGWYGNALQAASLRGHYHVIQLLLEKGADVNAPGCLRYGDALQAASFRGHNQVVQMLLEKGADVNAPGGRYGRALQAA